MRNKLLAGIFAATMAVSGLVGVAPASATLPVPQTPPDVDISGAILTLTDATWDSGAVFHSVSACASPVTTSSGVLKPAGCGVELYVVQADPTQSPTDMTLPTDLRTAVTYDGINYSQFNPTGTAHIIYASLSISGPYRLWVWSDSVAYNAVASVAETPPSYTGPMITPPAGVIAAGAGGKVTIPGSRLGGVSKVEIAGLDAQVVVNSDGSIEITVPAGLAAGVYDLVIVSDSGRLTVQGAIRITGAASGATASGVAGEARPSTRMIAENTVKVWVFDAVGAGKVQIKLNGREVAWVNAASAADPKLRDGYLVRTLTLAAGKNVIEVYVDGERVSRRVATGS